MGEIKLDMSSRSEFEKLEIKLAGEKQGGWEFRVKGKSPGPTIEGSQGHERASKGARGRPGNILSVQKDTLTQSCFKSLIFEHHRPWMRAVPGVPLS